MEKIAVVGCGKAGRGWAMLFAASGFKVCIYDNISKQLEDGLADIHSQMDKLKGTGQLRGTLSVAEQMALIEGAVDLKSCIQDAFYIQECVFEDAELKKQVNSAIDTLMSGEAILASSTSYVEPGYISDHLVHRNRFIVAHPTNPPYYVPLVELLPGQWADEDVLTNTRDLMKKIEQIPITIKKYVDGYARNRIQNVIFKECFDLFGKGVMTASDIDLVMTEGLGRRYAFMGVLETAYLNAHGFDVYSERYGEVINQVQNSLSPPPSFTDIAILEKIQEEMVKKAPLEKLNERYKWRATRTSELSQLIKDMDVADSRQIN